MTVPRVYILQLTFVTCTRVNYVWCHQLFSRLAAAAFLPQKLICGGFKNAPVFAQGNNDSSLICENP